MINLQNVETITLNGGRVTGTIDASAVTGTTGITFNLASGRADGDIIGSPQNDTFTITGNVTSNSLNIIGVIQGGDGTADVLEIDTGATVAGIAFSSTNPTGGAVNLQNIEIIRLNGGTINGNITGSAGDDIFIIAGDMVTDTDSDTPAVEAALAINGEIQGGDGDADELQLNEGAVVEGIVYTDFVAELGATLALETIETITINGGSVIGIDAGTIDAGAAPTGVTFNLTAGTIGGDVLGGAEDDIFVIGAGITVGGMIDGGLGGTDTLSLAEGFTTTSVSLSGGGVLTLVSASGTVELTVIGFETFDIPGLSITFPGATAEADTFAISNDITSTTSTTPSILTTAINGGGGIDEFQLNLGAVVASVAYSNTAPMGGAVNLFGIEIITLDGGVVNGAIDAGSFTADTGTGTTGVTFNLIRGGAGSGNIIGSPRDDIFILSGDITGANPALDINGLIQGGNGTADEVRLITDSVVNSLDFNVFVEGNLSLQNVEIITIDGGTVNTEINAATAPAITFNLMSGTVSGNVTGSDNNDTFNLRGATVSGFFSGRDGADTFNLESGTIIGNVDGGSGNDEFIFSGDATGDDPALDINIVFDGAGGSADEFRLVADGVVNSIAFSDMATSSSDDISLQNVETITIDGGTVNTEITAAAATTAITFNLTSGTITGDVIGTSQVDSFVIGADITVGGTLDGGGGADTLSLAMGFEPTAANLFSSVLALTLTSREIITFALANIATANIGLGSLITLTEVAPIALTIPAATTGADIFAITTDITNPGLSPLASVIDGAGGIDELQLNIGAVVASIAFAATAPTDGVVNLRRIETITLNGGTAEGAIDASAAASTTGITFNLASGRTDGDIIGSPQNDTFRITGDVTSNSLNINGVIQGGGGTADVLELNTDAAVVASIAFANTAPTDGAINLQTIETITLDGGTVNDQIDASAAPTAAGVRVNLMSGDIQGVTVGTDEVAITGSAGDDAFIITGDLTGETPGLIISGEIRGGGGDADEVQLNAGAAVEGIAYANFVAESGAVLALESIETITINGGSVTGIDAGTINAEAALTGITFNLTAGTIGGDVLGGAEDDIFVIGAGITIGGMIDGGLGGTDTLSLADGFSTTSVSLSGGGVLTLVSASGTVELTVIGFETFDIPELTLALPVGTGGANTFAISNDITGTTSLLTTAINGLGGTDEFQLNLGAVVASVAYANEVPPAGAVNLHRIEIITLDGGVVNGAIDASGLTGDIGAMFNLASGRVDGDITGSPRDDAFIVSGDITGTDPALDLNGLLQGGDGDADEVRLITGGVVNSIDFSTTFAEGNLSLQAVEVITIDGGTVNTEITAATGTGTSAITFNLTSGIIIGDVIGTSQVDSFVIGAGITIGGMIDGGGEEADTLSLAMGFDPD